MQNKEQPKSPYMPDELQHKWDNEKLTFDQVCGQILVWLERLHTRTQALERQVENLEGEIADVVARVATLEEGKSKQW